MVNMDDVYIPNTQSHQRTWTGECNTGPYSPNIDEDDESYVPTNPADQSISGLFSYRKWNISPENNEYN